MTDAPERICPPWAFRRTFAWIPIDSGGLAPHAAEIDRLTARVAELERALLPFSNEAGWWLEKNYSASDSPVEGFSDYQGVMTCGDLFAARAALTSQEAAQ